MKTSRIKLGRLGAGAVRNLGTLGIEFLVNAGPRAPMTVMRVAMKPGASHEPLYHARTSEFFVVTRGSQEARIGRRLLHLRKGNYVFLPPRTTHAFKAGPRGVEVLSIFTPALHPTKPDIVTVPARGRKTQPA